MEKALIGGGCFWSIEEYYRKLQGIINTKVGYSGGHIENPTYEDVCLGTTEHVEVVQIEFNEKIIPYSQIIKYFWLCHDPTQLNRQGPDIGRQYRSVIFYFSDEQQKLAFESKKQKQLSLSDLIVTEILPAKEFYLAEKYHQLFIYKRGKTET
jgi:peptide-methionine (S)-S-oxide reductase